MDKSRGLAKTKQVVLTLLGCMTAMHDGYDGYNSRDDHAGYDPLLTRARVVSFCFVGSEPDIARTQRLWSSEF